jgi:hypothetical protein
MPIVIKELFPSDPLSEALEKINFNFDQVILAGGGPPGPLGPQGVPGIPGPQGERGDHWQVGTTAPTADHGPNFGSLKDFDFWISATGQVYYWSIGASAWISSGTNLTGPQGSNGATGGSFEVGMYRGSTGNAVTPGSTPPFLVTTNYTPGISGATTVASGGVDFIIPVNINKNSFFLGASGWAYNYLNNFGVYDVEFPGNIQRLTPKQAIIQTGIDWTGLGGLTIGAYGATSVVGPGISNYIGDPTAVTDALDFFTAGFAIKQVGGNYGHSFRMRTGTIDLEIQAGDNNYLELAAGKTPDLILKSNRTLISDWAGARAIFNNTSTMLREKVAIGYSSLPTFDFISGATSSLDTISHARVRGNLLIGDLSGTSSRALIGYGRTVDGSSNLEFYSFGLTPTIATFSIIRGSGNNGDSIIRNEGTGSIIFSRSGGSETMRLTSLGNVGIGTPTPITRLDVNGAIRTTGNAGLPTSTGSGPILTGIVSSPNIGKLYIGDGTGWKFHFSRRASSADTDLVTIQDNGFVGIGTTTPTLKLEVFDSSTGDIAQIGTSSPSAYNRLFFQKPTQKWSIGQINTNQFAISNETIPSYRMTFETGVAGNILMLTGTGNVGIGTSTPAYKVHIQDNSENALLIRSNSNTAGQQNNMVFQRQWGTSATPAGVFLGGISFGGFDGTNWTTGSNGGSQIVSNAAGSGVWTGSSRASNLRFLTTTNGSASATEKMIITDLGYIGIGTSTPQAPLQITKSSSAPVGTGNFASTIQLSATLTATSNSQSLVGLDVNPTFNSSSYSNVGTYAARFWGDVIILNSASQMIIQNGTAASPGIRVASGEYGMYYNSRLGFSIGGISRLDFDSNDMAARVEAFAIDNPTGASILQLKSLRAASPATNTNTFFGRYGNDDAAFIRVDLNNTTPVAPNWNAEFRFTTAGEATKPVGGPNWIITSDSRVKKDIRPFTDGLDKLLKLNPVYFKYISEDTKERVGFVAQEVEEVVDYMVSINEGREINDLRSIDESPLTKILVNSIKEQQNIINELIKRIENLESKS